MADALVADMQGVPLEKGAVDVTFDVDGDGGILLAEARRKSSELATLVVEAEAARVAATAALVGDKRFTGRDVAAILKVSPGRVSQIMSGRSKGKRNGRISV